MPSMANSFDTFGSPAWNPAAMNGQTNSGYGQTNGNTGMSPDMRGNVGSLITYIIDTVIAATGVSMSDPKIYNAIMTLKLTTSMLFQELVQEEARQINRS